MARLALLRLSCPACHGKDLIRTRRKRIAALFGLKSFRCRDCNSRILSFLTGLESTFTSTTQVAETGITADETPSVFIPLFSESRSGAPGLQNVFSHFDSRNWEPSPHFPGVNTKTVSLSNETVLQLVKLDMSAAIDFDSNHASTLLCCLEGNALKSDTRITPGWCGALYQDNDPVTITAKEESLFLIAASNHTPSN